MVTTGKVRHGAVETEGKDLPEGATITILVPEGDETFVLWPEHEGRLLAAIGKVERGEVVDASVVLGPRDCGGWAMVGREPSHGAESLRGGA